MAQEQLFRGRDKRKKGWFWMDNDYLNGYAKYFGPIGTAIYVSLCRHTDNETQKCFPAMETIAEEIGTSINTVKKYIRLFEKYHLIGIEREKDPRTKRWLNNIYTVRDKEEWVRIDKILFKKKRNIREPQPTIGSGKPQPIVDESHSQPLDNKETHLKETQNMSDKLTYSLKEEIEKLLIDKRRHIQIIGLWIQEMNLKPENSDQIQSIIHRNSRPAVLLKGYKNEDIQETIKILKRTEYLQGHFGIETITKFIDKVVATKKKKGPRIIKWEERRDEKGVIRAKPIFEVKK